MKKDNNDTCHGMEEVDRGSKGFPYKLQVYNSNTHSMDD